MTDLKRAWPFLRIPIALIGIGLFFTFYNRFLLDASLRNLRTSLSILDAASGVGQAEAALLLVDHALVAEIATEEKDLQRLVTFQYAQGVLARDQRFRPVEDAQAMLAILGDDQAAGRAGLLRTMDAFSAGAGKALRQGTRLPQQLFRGRGSPEIDETRLQEAIRQERIGQLQRAAALYEALLKDYPRYMGRAGLKLRLGHLYQRAQAPASPERLYREAAREAGSINESQAAQRMLEELTRSQRKKGHVKPLEKRLSQLGPGPARQRTAHELASLLLQLYQLDRAAEIFRQAFLADPEGELAFSSLFNEASCFRTAGRLEESLVALLAIVRKDPGSPWAAASYLQIAELYKATGDPNTAAAIYEHALSVTRDPAMRAVLHAQAGTTYYFDLTDPGKAHGHFLELERKYPASPFAGLWNRIERLMERKGTALTALGGAPSPAPLPVEKAPPSTALAPGSPILNWLEGFLPVFVDVFSDQLAKYMRAVGEKELTRRFTEAEFQDLVVRQVQKRFPGQVTEIRTEIVPGSFAGSGMVKLGILRFKVEARIGIQVVDEKPNAALQEIRVGKLAVPQRLVNYLEKRVNSVIQRADYPLKVKSYELHEGYALISVELVEVPR